MSLNNASRKGTKSPVHETIALKSEKLCHIALAGFESSRCLLVQYEITELTQPYFLKS